MAALNDPRCTENGNGIGQSDSSSLRAVSRSAGDLERYKARVWQLYAHHPIKQVCEILKKEDRIIVSVKMLRGALQQWGATKAIKSEHKKYMIGLRRKREREGRATVIQYSLHSPGYVAKQLDRFIAEKEVHEHEQLEWESLVGPLPKEITYFTPREPENASSGSEENLTATIEEHLQDQVSPETIRVSATEPREPMGTVRSPWACVSVENPLSEQQRNDVNRRALQLHEKHNGNIEYHWRNIYKVAEQFWNSLKFDEAEELDRMAIELAEHHWGADNKDTLVLKGNLASTLWAQGRYNEAWQLEADVVKSLEGSEGPDSEETLWYKNSLSITLRAQGRFEEAKSLSRDTVERAAKMLGDDHDSTLLFKVNLARAYNDLRQWIEAKKVLKTVTEIREKTLGVSDKRTLQAYIVLGSTLQSLELWDQAGVINEVVKSEIDRSGYDTSFWTLEFMDNLAKQSFGLGQYFEAERIFRDQASQRERLLSARHPQTLASNVGIAHCLHCQTKSRQAVEIGQHVLTEMKEVLGDDHPSTLTVMVNLAWYECDTRSWHDFVSKMREVHRLRQARLGDDNPDTVQSSLCIARGESQRGNFQEAQEIFDSTYGQFLKIYGSENHPDMIAWTNWKADACEMNGQDNEAESLRRKAHKLASEIFGERHPSTLLNAKYFISLILRLGRHNEAEEMASNITSKISEILGSEHPRSMEFVQVIACINIRQGKWANAGSLYARVLKAFESYGETHPYVIFAKANLAQTQAWQGQFSEADKLLQSALDSATRVFDHEHSDFINLLAVAAHTKLAQDNWKDAIDLYQEIATKRAKFMESGHFEFIDIAFKVARAQAELGYLEQSEESFQRALDRSKQVFGDKHFMTLRAKSEMAWLQTKHGRWREAIQTQYAVLDANTQTLGEHHPETRNARQRRAWMVAGSGDYSTSEIFYKDVLEKETSLYGRNHTVTLDVLSDMAWLRRKNGDLAAAVRLYRELLDARCALLGYWNKSTMTTRMQLCELLTFLGSFAECKAICDDALWQAKLNFGETSRQTALVLSDIAFLYRNADVLAEAEKYLKKALTILENVGEQSPTRVFLMLDLAECYRRQDRYRMAASQVEKAKEMGEGFLGPRHPAMLSARKSLALSRLDMNDFDGAEETVRALLQQCDNTNEFFVSNTLELKQMLGRIFLAQGKVEESEILFTETIIPVMNGNIPTGSAKALLSFIEEFASIKQKLRHLAEAEALLETVLSIRMQNPMSTDLEMSHTLRSLGSVKKDLGKYSEAESLQSRVVDITKSVWGEHSEQHLYASRALATCLNHPDALLERYSIQIQAAKKYVELYKKEFPRWVPILREIAVTLKLLRQYEDAETLQRAVLWWRHENHEEVSEQYLWDVEFLAETYFGGDKYECVKRMYEIAAKGYRHLFGESHAGTIRCIKALGALAFKCGEMNESEEIFERILPIVREKVPKGDPQYIQVVDGLALTKLNLWRLKEAKDLTLECLNVRMQQGGERTPSVEELFLRLVLIDNIELKEIVSKWERESVAENFIDLLLRKLSDSKSAERVWFNGVVSVWSGFIFANDPAKSFKYWLWDTDIDTIIDSLSDSGSVGRAWLSTWFIDDLKIVFNGVFGRGIEERGHLELAERRVDGLKDTVRSVIDVGRYPNPPEANEKNCVVEGIATKDVEESESKFAPSLDTSELLRLLQPILGQQPKDADIIAMLEKLVPE